MSALSVLAESKNYIEKLFTVKKKNEEGLYGVYMCIDGVFKEILLDDYLPSKGSFKWFKYYKF